MPGHAPRVLRSSGNAELLNRAVENVVRNAVRHAPEGTAVEVSLERDGGAIAARKHPEGGLLVEITLPAAVAA